MQKKTLGTDTSTETHPNDCFFFRGRGGGESNSFNHILYHQVVKLQDLPAETKVWSSFLQFSYWAEYPISLTDKIFSKSTNEKTKKRRRNDSVRSFSYIRTGIYSFNLTIEDATFTTIYNSTNWPFLVGMENPLLQTLFLHAWSSAPIFSLWKKTKTKPRL